VRNVIVTGGTRGIGLAIAVRLAAEGYRVIAVARSLGDLEPVRSDTLQFLQADLAELDSIPALVSSVTKTLGPLYGLVNNAGIGTSGILATMPDRQIEALLRLNIAAPIKLTKHAVRAMMVGGAGRIVMMSSIVAATGYAGLSVYAATKSALTGFTHSLAREVGPLGITVNCVAPGFVETAMTDEMSALDRQRVAKRSALRRLAEAQDVAHAVCYLLSDGARNVTGTTLTVDAGTTA
jgi:3-oxoacyl-[acyl-carrier protein] reductase